MKRYLLLITFLMLLKFATCQVFGNMIERVIQPTVKIEFANGNGSGILVQDTNLNISLITAKHVIFDPNSNFVNLNSNRAAIQFYAKDFRTDSANYILLDLKKLHKDKLILADSIHDICIIKIAKVGNTGLIKYNNGIGRIGHQVKYLPYIIDNSATMAKSELYLGEEIFLIGFPSSIGLEKIPQFDYDKPLLKRGAIASISDKYDNFIIDCLVYQGNSGGPVFLERKGFGNYSLRLIGIVSQFIPFINSTLTNKDATVQHSSYAVIVPIEYGLQLLIE